MKINRRKFIKTGIAAAAGLGLSQYARALEGQDPAEAVSKQKKLIPKADAMIMIWLPGGMAQTDLWDPKKFTPYEKGMKGSKLLGTCKSISTAADGIFLTEGLENIASVMDKGTILRSLT